MGALRVPHAESDLYGASVGARRALDRRKRLVAGRPGQVAWGYVMGAVIMVLVVTPQVRPGLYPSVTFQYSSTTLYQFSDHIQ